MRVNIYDQRLFGAGCELWGLCPISACCSSSNNYVVAPLLLLWIKSKPSGQVNLALGSELILYMSSLLYTCHLPLATCLMLHLQVSPSMRQWNAAWRTVAPIPVAVPMALSIAVRRVWRVCPLHCRTIQPNCKCCQIPQNIISSVTNILTVLQSPGAELHYGAASEILLQFPTLATHRSVQQQHLEDCTRCAKWPQAANNAVSRRALATSSTL